MLKFKSEGTIYDIICHKRFPKGVKKELNKYVSHYIPLKLWKNNHSSSLIALIVHVGQFSFNTFLTFLCLTFHRATVKKGVTFRTATPSNSLLWDITLDMGADGAIAVVCQRKAPIPGKRQVCSPYASVCVFLVLSLGITYIVRITLDRSKRIFFFSCTVGCQCL